MSGFGLDHLPYASASHGREDLLVARFEDRAFALRDLVGLSEQARAAVDAPNLDRLLTSDPAVWSEVRSALQEALAARPESVASWPIGVLEMRMPFTPGDYVDFYASEHHATNVGRLFRPGQPALLANWKHLPVGYHGRSGTMGIEGAVSRPLGLRPTEAGEPEFGPSAQLDLEAELAVVVGAQHPRAHVSLAEARQHLFGVTLLNDWSARDVQRFEYVPLGPFLGKSFVTTISPWVTPLAALESARVPPPPREVKLSAYLDDDALEMWGLDIRMEVVINGEVVSRPPLESTYWTAPQMLSHMTVNGATIRAGDVFAAGTVSGSRDDEVGSLLELTRNGQQPYVMQSGRELRYLEDGDVVTLRATAPSSSGGFIQLGECVGVVEPARSFTPLR